MSFFTITLPSGVVWTPKFIATIDEEKCIGCGRCYKTCSQDVLELRAINDEGEVVSIEDGDDDEYEKKVMAVAHPENCVGCQSCANNCSRSCMEHEAKAA